VDFKSSENASNAQSFRDLDEHRRVVDVDDPRRGVWATSNASRKMFTSGLRMWTKQEVLMTGIREPVQLERANAICIHLAGFIADDNDLQAIPDLETCNQLDHSGVRLRLRKDEVRNWLRVNGRFR